MLLFLVAVPHLVLSTCPTNGVVDWLNWGYDAFHSNENPCETKITTTSASLGLLWSKSVSGSVLAQPLVVSQYLSKSRGLFDDAVIVATTHGFVYMFDASNGKQIWKKSLGSLNDCNDMPGGIWGVTGTPLVDRGGGFIYVVNLANVHCLNLKYGTPCSKWGTSASLGDPSQTQSMANNLYATYGGLTLLGNTLYATMASHCDQNTYYGHVTAINTANGLLVGTPWYAVPLNARISGGKPYYGGGVWGTGPGLLLRPDLKTAFVATGNGIVSGNYGTDENEFLANHVVQLSFITGGALSTSSNFSSSNTLDNQNDNDFGATPTVFMPQGCSKTLVVATQKLGQLWVLDSSTMAEIQARHAE